MPLTPKAERRHRVHYLAIPNQELSSANKASTSPKTQCEEVVVVMVVEGDKDTACPLAARDWQCFRRKETAGAGEWDKKKESEPGEASRLSS
jgi:hypothetical protein